MCLAIALHDVDGPIHCQSGEKIRLHGIGATEMSGECRPHQPCVPGDPREQRRKMAKIIGATIGREDPSEYGQAWFAKAVPLRCSITGHSHKRLTAWYSRSDGADLSCAAIRAGVAKRWPEYDRKGDLRRCIPMD